MIPALLWRCPLCAEPEALTHQRPFLRREVVSCTACGAHWRVRRIPGDDFYLRLDKPSVAHPMPIGQEYPLAAWYDRMKSGLSLEAISHPQFTLNLSENLYLALQDAELWVAPSDPLVIGRQADSPDVIAPSGEDLAVRLGYGHLFLTNQRLAWQSEKYNQDFQLTRIQGAYAVGNLGLAVTSGSRLVFFQFLHESPLKWASYFGLLAAQVLIETGHCIETTHW